MMEEVLPALPFRRLCPCALNPSGPACKRSIEFSDLKMVVHSIGIHAHESGAAWASPPAQAIIRNGATIKDERGKVVYSPPQFGSVEVRRPWSDRVVAEVLKFDPRALECRQTAS